MNGTGRSHELVAESVSVRYGRAIAVNDVSIDVPGGQITALVGPNGAGKTSLVLSIYGSVPGTGTIRIDGDDVSGLRATERARRGIAIVPQGRQLFPRLSVRENLVVMADVLGLGTDEVEHAIDRFPILRERAKSLAGVLSGGEQQMLVVTRALMGRPRAMLLDETMTGLAPLIVAELAETFVRLAREEGVAVLLAEPAIGQLSPIIDRGVVIRRGEIVARNEDGGAALDRAYKDAVGIGVGVD